MSNDILPDWERVLASAAHLQRILPEAFSLVALPRQSMVDIAFQRMPFKR